MTPPHACFHSGVRRGRRAHRDEFRHVGSSTSLSTFRRFGFSAFRRFGFSLLELMVAIMILGVGVVMVATVFPVGIEISRQPIQTYINLAIADTAAATLSAKVPGYRNLNVAATGNNFSQIILNSTSRVLVPDVQNIEITSPGEDPCIINEQEVELFTNLGAPPTMLFPVGPLPPISHLGWKTDPFWLTTVDPNQPPVPLAPKNQTLPEFISRTRVFTERTGWSAEVDGSPLSGFITAAVVPSQNLPANAALRDAIPDLNSLPVMVHPSLSGTYTSDLPRVNLVDQVYPPINLNLPIGVTREYQDRNVAWGGGITVPGVRRDLELSRYCWLALHHRLSSEAPQAGKTRTNRDILATIVTLHRADLGARFARQQTLEDDKASGDYHVAFDIGDDDDVEALCQPQADQAVATDAMFPRPWLTAIYNLNTPNGEAYVTAELARMLPTGAYFVIAGKPFSIAPSSGRYTWNTDILAGTFIQVTRSEWDPSRVGNSSYSFSAASPNDVDTYAWTRIEITRSSARLLGAPPPGSSGPLWPVWVFPPAVTNLAGVRKVATEYDFQSRSPAVGVELRRIAVK